jgi:hypothetical protein
MPLRQYEVTQVIGEAADFDSFTDDLPNALDRIKDQLAEHLDRGETHWINIEFSVDGVTSRCITIGNP